MLSTCNEEEANDDNVVVDDLNYIPPSRFTPVLHPHFNWFLRHLGDAKKHSRISEGIEKKCQLGLTRETN